MRVNAFHYANLVHLLTVAPHTTRELAEQTGLHVHTVRTHVNALHSRGVVRIVGWAEGARGYPQLPEYELGSGPDAPRPRMSNAERQRRCRRRKKLQRLQHITAGQLPA